MILHITVSTSTENRGVFSQVLADAEYINIQERITKKVTNFPINQLKTCIEPVHCVWASSRRRATHCNVCAQHAIGGEGGMQQYTHAQCQRIGSKRASVLAGCTMSKTSEDGDIDLKTVCRLFGDIDCNGGICNLSNSLPSFSRICLFVLFSDLCRLSKNLRVRSSIGRFVYPLHQLMCFSRVPVLLQSWFWLDI